MLTISAGIGIWSNHLEHANNKIPFIISLSMLLSASDAPGLSRELLLLVFHLCRPLQNTPHNSNEASHITYIHHTCRNTPEVSDRKRSQRPFTWTQMHWRSTQIRIDEGFCLRGLAKRRGHPKDNPNKIISINKKLKVQ